MGSSGNITKSVKSRINDNGRIIIPAPIRQKMGLKAGDAVVMTLEADVLRIESQMTRIRHIQESLRSLISPGRVLSDELIAERREEAHKEIEEALE